MGGPGRRGVMRRSRLSCRSFFNFAVLVLPIFPLSFLFFFHSLVLFPFFFCKCLSNNQFFRARPPLMDLLHHVKVDLGKLAWASFLVVFTIYAVVTFINILILAQEILFIGAGKMCCIRFSSRMVCQNRIFTGSTCSSHWLPC